MQRVSLIPFIVGLIGYDQCVRDSPELWKYGPEYNFHLQVYGRLSIKPTHDVESNISAIMQCRPFTTNSASSNNALRCHIDNAEVDNYETNKSSLPPEIMRPMPPEPFEITGFTFDIVFGMDRINEIRIHQEIKNFRMNMYRDILSQLDIAFDRFAQTNQRFSARDYARSPVGECDTKLEKFRRFKSPKTEWDSPCKQLRLEVTGTNYPLVLIDKTRNMNNCTKKTPYFFGRENVASTAPSITAEIISSVSGIMIAPQNFESRTTRTGTLTLHTTDQKTSYPVTEEISLLLTSIEPASTPFEPLEVYGRTGVLADEPIITSTNHLHRPSE
ncbi:uncharacterized protein LOC135166929 [Diachasmimorpha longicaudata]|uniref:uncharacterized protein LOC135166929 n=1 Tax=Diachasmimorpha longicaudata TaxID=58733 RepID=UPI0030B876AF